MKNEQQAKEIGNRIRTKREKMGMTQEQLASKLGYKSKSSITKIENGTRDLRQKNIKAIADALETTPSYLMGWRDEDAMRVLGYVAKQRREAKGGTEPLGKTYVYIPQNSLNLEIGKALYKARVNANLTRNDIAERLVVSDDTVFFWEAGKIPIDIDAFKQYCDIVNVNWIDMLKSLPSEKKHRKIDN